MEVWLICQICYEDLSVEMGDLWLPFPSDFAIEIAVFEASGLITGLVSPDPAAGAAVSLRFACCLDLSPDM